MQAGVALPCIQVLLQSIEVLEIAARECVFRENEERKCVYVVRSGLLKQYYTSEDGSEWIKSFTSEGTPFACPEALSASGRTSFSSEAIEPSIVECISYPTVQRLAHEHLPWQHALSWAFQQLAMLKMRRERDLLMLTAEQLYASFCTRFPELVLRVPQKDLASYLGVTAVGLNRIVRRHRIASPLSRKA
jgi:CRP-like cAMP-binding protein